MPLNGKTHHHLLKSLDKKIEPSTEKYRDHVKHQENSIYGKSWDKLTLTNMLPEREDRESDRLKETYLKDK